VKGYKIPFKAFPPPTVCSQSILSSEDTAVMNQLIPKMVKAGVVSTCDHDSREFISPVFLVPKKDGTKRFILNLKMLNLYVKEEHFKIEDLRTAKRLISKGDYFASIDLQEAYWHVPIHETYKIYLRFMFGGQLYQFNCLPFGLSSAPRVFTKLLKPVVAFLREKGYLSVIFLDDILLIGSTFDQCSRNIDESVKLLTFLGFTVNLQKSVVVPTKKITFLGFELNSVTNTVELPQKKSDKIMRLGMQVINSKNLSVLCFSRFLGTIVSACPAVPYGMFHTKLMERDKYTSLGSDRLLFSKQMNLSKEAIDDIRWWINHCTGAKMPMNNPPFNCTIFSDASLSGWGASCSGQRAHGWWNDQEKEESINFLELKAAYYALRAFTNKQSNLSILFRIDNTTAISYINRFGGVKYPKLNHLARKIWSYSELNAHYIYASYINTNDNVVADAESRSSEYNSEWTLDRNCFLSVLDHLNFHPTIDLFASHANAQLDLYISWRPDPYAFEVDAFSMTWTDLQFYCFPPFSLCARVLQKVREEEAEGIIIVPQWPTQPWWPLLIRLSKFRLLELPFNEHLIHFNRQLHPLGKQLTLVASFLSGKRF